MSLYGLDHDRAFARCEADYLREPDWREPSEDELDAADAREAQRAIDDGEVTQHLPWERAWSTADAAGGGAR